MSDAPPLLSVRNLEKHYTRTTGVLGSDVVGRVRAVDGITFDLHRGETLALVGETGCGKSTTARTVLGLEEPTAGDVAFDGTSLAELDSADRSQFRRRVGMVFQDPTASLDPRMTVGESVGEPLLVHGLRDRARRRERVESLLQRVGLSPEIRGRYPHELSGGQTQRAALARALILQPDLLVADEPVNALDASVQAAFLDLLADLSADFGLAVLFISHDLTVVRAVAERTAVMYLGQIVEQGPTDALLHEPAHPYTRALVDSIPVPDPSQPLARASLEGDVPDPSEPPAGCRFHTRCPAVIQPEGSSIDEDTWGSIVSLRRDLVTGRIDLEQLRSLGGRPDSNGTEDGGLEREKSGGRQRMGDQEVSPVRGANLETAIREAYSLPEQFEDRAAGRVMEEVLSALAEEDIGAARERLDRAFDSVCIEQEPELAPIAEGHRVACHLHD
jgi:peptide/nickel transport system ATP-binding protein